MKQIFVALAFLSMVLSPCFVAMTAQLHCGADDFYDAGRADEEEYEPQR